MLLSAGRKVDRYCGPGAGGGAGDGIARIKGNGLTRKKPLINTAPLLEVLSLGFAQPKILSLSEQCPTDVRSDT